MGTKVNYSCPIDKDVVLFIEDSGQMNMIVAQRPKTCPKCKKLYYKWECVAESFAKMKMRGEDTENGLREWVKSELKEGPRQGYDLGKFFFSVSAATIGAIAAIEKLGATPKMDPWLIVSFVVLFVSVLVAVDLARPRKFLFGGDTDLLVEYEKQVDFVLCRVWVWLVLWLAGTVVGGYAVRI